MRQRTGHLGLGQFCKRDQNNVQQQDKDSRCQIEDQILQTREIKHSGFHDQIWSTSHEDWYRWTAYCYGTFGH